MAIFANVYVGTSTNDHTGDALRNAFQKINRNFANIAAQGNAVAGVSSVAGRTGNIQLGVNDVAGAVSISYVNNLPFTMANSQHWTSNVSTVNEALNQLAERLYAVNYPEIDGGNADSF